MRIDITRRGGIRRSGCLTICGAFGSVVIAAAQSQATTRAGQSIQAATPIAERELNAERGVDVVAFRLPSASIGWTVRLRTGLGDQLSFRVLPLDPRINPGIAPLCHSSGIPGISTCRFLLPPEAHLLWIAVESPNAKGKYRYVLDATPLIGPRLGNTPMMAGDARTLPVGQSVDSTFRFSDVSPETSLQHVYAITGAGRGDDSVYMAVDSKDGVALGARVFEADGSPRLGTALDSVRAFAQVRLGRARNATIFVILEPRNSSDVLRAPEYRIEVTERGSVPVIPLSAGSRSWEGEGRQRFSFMAPPGWSGAIRLDGEGNRLTARVRGIEHPVTPVFDSTSYILWVGNRVDTGSHLFGPLRDSATVELAVEPMDTTGYGNSWVIEVAGKLGGSQTYLGILPTRSRIPTHTFAGEAPVYSGRTNEQGAFVVALTSPFDPFQGLPSLLETRLRFRAQLDERAGRQLDIAICDAFGAVVGIGEEFVSWRWPARTIELFAVAFPQPGDRNASAAVPVTIRFTSPLKPPARERVPTDQRPPTRNPRPEAVELPPRP